MTPPQNATEKPLDRLTKDEIEWFRDNKEWLDTQRQSSEHEAWLRGRIKVIYPWLITIVGVLVAAGDWLHKTFTTR